MLVITAVHASASPASVRVRLWSHHPPQQIQLRATGQAQVRRCGTCGFRPLSHLVLEADGNHIRIGKALALAVSVRGSYELTAESTRIPLSWATELRANNGRLNMIVAMPLEEYVSGVLAGEAGGVRAPEALKAMAVAVRTYAVHFMGRHSQEGFDFCDTTHCQDLRVSPISRRGRISSTRNPRS